MLRGRHRQRSRTRSRRTARVLEPALLLFLHEGPAHGYTLVKRVRTFGLEGVDASALYRKLRDMEANEWITSRWDSEGRQGPPRRVYHLAPLGDMVLSVWVEDLGETRAVLDNLVGAYHRHMREGDGDYHH